MMHEEEKSDSPIVPAKPVNKAASAAAESPSRWRVFDTTGSGGTKRNAGQQSTDRTQCRETVSQTQARIREAVSRNPIDFLGFTHICETQADGSGFQLWRKTIRKRLKAKVREIKEELRRHVHASIAEQGRWLGSVMRGDFAYHAVPTNLMAIAAFRHHVIVRWLRVLRRRRQRHRMTWARMQRIIDRYLPKARVLHPWPDERFRVTLSRSEPDAGNLPVRICAGGGQQ